MENHIDNGSGPLHMIRVLLERTNSVSRSTYFWNALNATLSAAQQAMILIVMNRTNGIRDAGIFSIAYAVASLMLFVGQYGLRRYQASDIEEEMSFSEYLGMRFVTCGAMIIASLVYCGWCMAFGNYTMTKFIVVFLVCLEKVIQAFADVLHGRMQQAGRLDVAAKASASRIVLSTLMFMISLLITHQLIVSTVVWVLANLLIYLLTSQNVLRNYAEFRPSFRFEAIKRLTIIGLPLFLSYFLSMYIGNAPKYAIDRYLTDDVQAYYNFIFMPAFAVQLLANFIFNPILTSYAHVWAEKRFKKFRKLIIRQMIVVLGITILGLGVAATIGIPILSVIFGVDLSSLKTELCIVMIGGGFLGYVTFFTTIITIIRHQNLLLLGYCTAAGAAMVLSKYFVLNYEMVGAAGLYAVLMGLLAFVFLVIMIVKIRKAEKEYKGKI